MDKQMICKIAFILVLVGAIDLGLLGLIDVNILGKFGTLLSRLIYIIIGASAGYLIYEKYFVKKA